MMCSSWKISVFGIVALMLMLGLVASDALAQTGRASRYGNDTIGVAVTGGTVPTVNLRDTSNAFGRLRAADKIETLTFTYTIAANTDDPAAVDSTAHATGDAVKGYVKIRIPRGWNDSFFKSSGDALEDRDGEVTIAGDAGVVDDWTVNGKVLTATVNDDGATGTITFTIERVNVPETMGTYIFEIESTLEPDPGSPHGATLHYLAPYDHHGDDSNPGVVHYPPGNPRRTAYELWVGPALSGTGTFKLDNPNLALGDYDGPDDGDKKGDSDGTNDAWEEPTGTGTNQVEYEYLAYSGQALGNITFTYTAKGDMEKGATIIITRDNSDGGNPEFPEFAHGGSTGVLDVISGPADALSGDIAPAATVTTNAVLPAGGKIVLRYSNITVPKLDPATSIQRFAFLATANSPMSIIEEVLPNNFRTGHGGSAAVAGTNAEVSDDSPEVITVTAPAGTGELTLEARGTAGDTGTATSLTQAIAGEDLDNLVFLFTAKGGMAIGSKVMVDIPDAWGEIFPDNGDGTEQPGEIRLTQGDASATFETAGRTVTLTTTGELADTGVIEFALATESVPSTANEYTFRTRASSGTHQMPDDIGTQPKMDVTVPHGSGTVELRRGGRTFREATAEQILGNLQFVYTADGRMAKDSVVTIFLPPDWPRARYNNDNNQPDQGEIVLGGSAGANLDLTDTRLMKATATEPWDAGDTLTFTYIGVTAPPDAGSYEFTTRAISHPNGDIDSPGARLERSPTVGIDQAPDGSGTIALAKSEGTFETASTGEYIATAGEYLGDLTFTYTADGIMENGAEVVITIPDLWPEPVGDDFDGRSDDPGEVILSSSGTETLTVSTADRTITVFFPAALSSGDSFAVTYRAITAPSGGRDDDFVVTSRATADGTHVSLETGYPTIRVRAVDPGAVSLPINSAQPGDDLGDLVFTYTAGGALDAGAVIEITIPQGWQPPSRANDADDNRPGAVLISDNADLVVNTATSKLIGTTNSPLADDDTVMFTYQTITAPAAGSYTFGSAFSLNSEDPVSAIPSPSVVVRTVATELTLRTSALNFFVGESITVTVALDTRAPVDGLDVALTADSGTFSLTEGGEAIDTVKIEDSADPSSAMVYYRNDMASEDPVMLGATAMVGDVELSAEPAPVTVKSTISNLAVNGTAMPDPVQGTGEITVTVIGKDGEAEVTVTQKVTDANDVETDVAVVSTKGLDADPSATDVPEGSVAYTRKIDLGDANDGDGLTDGSYTVMVTIAGEPASIGIKVRNNLAAPTLENALATPVGADTVRDGGDVALSVKVTPNPTITIESVVADVSDLDSTKTAEATVALADADGDGTYSALFTVSADNEHEDGAKMVSFTATGEYGPASEAATADITLRNDFDAPVLTLVTDADLGLANDGDVLPITVSSESGLDVTADATSVGGGMVTLTEGTVEDDAAANGNGASNGNGATNGNGEAASGNGEAEEAPAGNGMYTAMIPVSGATDGEKTITITAHDDWEDNVSDAVTVNVTIDNTPPTLSMQNADPAVATHGTMVTISVNADESGLTITADASDIGGGTVTLTEAMMTANGNGNGAETDDSAMMYTYSGTATVGSDVEAGDYMIAINTMDAAGNAADEVSAPVSVQVDPIVADLMVAVDVPIAKGGSNITVSATGEADAVTSVSIMDSDGKATGPSVSLDRSGDPDEDGKQAYTRVIGLSTDLADGTYTVTVEIGDATDSATFRVVNDQEPPALSGATAWPDVVANGDDVALRVKVTMNASEVAIASVTADVSKLDSTQTEPVALGSLPSEPAGTYGGFHRISADNMAADGDVTVTFTATDELENSNTTTASIRLKNDVTAPTLTMPNADPATATEGTAITISVNGGESGLTVTADASAIGGSSMVTLTEGMMAADANGDAANGDAANGNGANGDAANGNGANGNGANGNGAVPMPAGNGMYSGMATVSGVDDGAHEITITATDGSGNSSTATATVTVDNTGPALTMESADPAMAKDGTMVTISVSSDDPDATVTADASAIGGDAATALAATDTAGMYSATVTVADGTADGDHMVSITGTDALGNEGDAVSVTVTVDNTAPTLSDAAITPDWAVNGDMVTISVSTEPDATVTANASDIGGAPDLALAESADTAGMYSAEVTVTGAAGGDQMVSITASDALGNMSDAATASVSIHAVTSASFSPADVSTGDSVKVEAMGTAGLTATFSVFDAEGNNIVTDGSLTEDAAAAGTYSGSFEVVIDAHPTGTYWVSVTIGEASMTADGELTIDHLAQFTLSIGEGIHLIHVPLDVTHINGDEGSIDTVGDLHDALGDAVEYIISLDSDGNYQSYLGDSSAGGIADAAIGDDTGLIAVMSSAASLTLAGNALGSATTSAINLGEGLNLVGVPLDPVAGLDMISDALTHPAVSSIVVSNAAGNGFHTITQAGDPGDGPIMGGVGYIVVTGAAASIPVVGSAWDNTGMMTASNGANGNGASAAPGLGFQTPVLHVQGKLIDEAGMVSRDGLNVSVRNVTRGTTLGSATATDDYSMTFVKLDSSAAKIGDVLEIRADSSNPLLGVRPVQHVVTADDVLDSRIDLPDLVTYEIPAQTELLANYPNPFNPETWIPFRLAEDSNVSLSIYGASGSLVRSIDIGFTPAAVYEGRSDAIYWDGRNDFGEQVSSGIYFYHLSAGSFSATRKMVIVK